MIYLAACQINWHVLFCIFLHGVESIYQTYIVKPCVSSAKYFLWMDANSHTSAKSNKHLTSCFTCKWGLLLRTATAFSFFLNPHVPSPYLSFCLLYFFAPVLSSTPSLRLLPGIDSWMSCQTLRAESWQSPCPSCRPVQFVCCASSKTSSTWCIPSLAKMNPLPIGQDVKETLRTGSIRGTSNNLPLPSDPLSFCVFSSSLVLILD